MRIHLLILHFRQGGIDMEMMCLPSREILQYLAEMVILHGDI